MSTTTSPTRAVLAVFESGAGSIHEIAERTGLDTGVVSLAIDRLATSGYLEVQRLRVGCPDDGCTTCPSGRGGRAGCGATVPGAPATAPVLITLGPLRR
jgi:hypothetical protein